MEEANDENHISENEMVNYFLQNIEQPESLHRMNVHLMKCHRCSENLSAMIAFSLESKLLETEQTKKAKEFFESPKYKELVNLMAEKFGESFSKKSGAGSYKELPGSESSAKEKPGSKFIINMSMTLEIK